MCAAIALKHGIVLSGQANGVLCTWDFESGKLLRELTKKHDGRVTCVSVSDDEDVAASGSTDGSIRVWNIALSKLRYALKMHPGAIVSLQFESGSQRIISGSSNGWVMMWNRTKGRHILVQLCERAKRHCVPKKMNGQ